MRGAENESLGDRMLSVRINKPFLFIREKLATVLVHIPIALILGFKVTFTYFLALHCQRHGRDSFLHPSFLITWLHIHTIFTCNKIRDYLAIFRRSSSSEPGQCCLYTFGVTSELSAGSRFTFAKGEISTAAMHHTDDRKCTYFIPYVWSPRTMGLDLF